MAKKYTIPFNSNYGKECQIDIYIEGATGDVIELIGGSNPFIVEQDRTNSSTALKGIIDTYYKIEFISTESVTLANFDHEQYGDVWFKYYEEGDLCHVGVISPFESGSPYEGDGYYAITLSGESGIKNLKNREFRTAEGAFVSGKITLQSAIYLCLTQLFQPNQFNFESRVGIEVFVDGAQVSTGEDFMSQYIDAEAFKTGINTWMSCYEVLETILAGTFDLTFDNKKWVIDYSRDYLASDRRITQYSASSFLSSNVVAVAPIVLDNGAILRNGSEGRQFSKKNIKISKEIKSVRNSLTNGVFASSGSDILGWTNEDSFSSKTIGGYGTQDAPYYVKIDGSVYGTPAPPSSDTEWMESTPFNWNPFGTLAFADREADTYHDNDERLKISLDAELGIGGVKGSGIEGHRLEIKVKFNELREIQIVVSQTGFFLPQIVERTLWYTNEGWSLTEAFYITGSNKVEQIEVTPPFVQQQQIYKYKSLEVGRYLIEEPTEFEVKIRIYRGARKKIGEAISEVVGYGYSIKYYAIGVATWLAKDDEFIAGASYEYVTTIKPDRESGDEITSWIYNDVYPFAYGSLFSTSSSTTPINGYQRRGTTLIQEWVEFLATDYLRQNDSRLYRLDLVMIGNHSSTQIFTYAGKRFRVYDYEYNVKSNQHKYTLIEVKDSGSDIILKSDEGAFETVVTSKPTNVITDYNTTENIYKEGGGTGLNKILKNLTKITGTNGKLNIGNSLVVEEFFYLVAAEGGTIKDVSEVTGEDWTLIKPAENGTYATREWVNKFYWGTEGNTLTVEKKFGTLNDFDIPIVRNNIEIAKVLSTGLKLSVLSNETTDVDKFLVSNNGLVKYRTGVQLLADIGALATPIGLTTNYVPKWNGTTFVDSLISGNGTNIGVNTPSPTYRLDVTGTGHFTDTVTFDKVPTSAEDATIGNQLVRYSQLLATTSIKYLPTPVKTVALSNITLSGEQTVTGYALVTGDRALVMGQTDAKQNGVYVVSSGAWTRATDSDTDTELRGYIVNVNAGTQAGYKYINTNTSTITIGTTNITYAEFSSVTESDPIFTAWRDTSRSANTFYSAPNGSSGVASFRALLAADIPNLPFSKITSGLPTTLSGYGITDAWKVGGNNSSGSLGTLIDSDISIIRNGVEKLLIQDLATSVRTPNFWIFNPSDFAYIRLSTSTFLQRIVATGGLTITSEFVTNFEIGSTTYGSISASGVDFTTLPVRYGTLLKPNNIAGTNKQVLSTSGTQDIWATLDLSYISSFNITTPTNGQVLKYDSTTSKWINGVETVYSHPTQTAISLASTGVEVFSTIEVNTLGHTTTFTKRTLPTASGTQIGVLSSADWATFNNKQNALTLGNITGSDFAITGGTGAVIGSGVGLALATITQGAGSIFGKFSLDTKGRVIGNTAVVKADLTSLLGTTQYLPYNTGTTNYLTKWSNTTGGLVNSQIFDNGSNIGIGVVPSSQYRVRVYGNITGNVTSFGITSEGIVQNDVTTQAIMFYSALSVAAAPSPQTLGFILHNRAVQGSIGANVTVGTQIGYWADASMNGATNNYGFRGSIASGAGRYNLYLDGTAQNYLRGNVGIGVVDALDVLHVNGYIRQTGIVSELVKADSAGRLIPAVANTDYINPSYTGFDSRYFTETESDSRFVALAGSYSNPSWISSLVWSKLTGVPTTFAPSAHTLDSHSNVTITSNSAGELLKWSGSAWINNTLAEAGISAVGHTHTTSDITNLSSYTGLDSRYYTETEVNTLFSTFSPTLTTNRIGIGVAGVLGSSTGLTWESNRYINITEGGNGTAWGISGSNAFIQAVNGDLRLEAGVSTSYSNTIQSISVHNFNKGIKLNNSFGTTGQVLTSQGGGVNTWATITSGSPTLTDTYIGFGSGGVLSGSSSLTWSANQIHITGGTGAFNLGKGGGDSQYYVDAATTVLNLYGTSVNINNKISLWNVGTGVKDFGTAGQVLTSGGAGGNNYWSTITGGGSQNLDSVLSVGNVGINKNIILNDTSGSSYNLIGQRNGVQKYTIGWENNLNRLWLTSAGLIDLYSATSELRIGHLSGSGLQMVTVDNNGYLGKQAIPSGGGGSSQDLDSVLSFGKISYGKGLDLRGYCPIEFKNAGGTLKAVTELYGTNDLYTWLSTGSRWAVGSNSIIFGSGSIASIADETENITLNGNNMNFGLSNAFGSAFGSYSTGAMFLMRYDGTRFTPMRVQEINSGGTYYLARY